MALGIIRAPWRSSGREPAQSLASPPGDVSHSLLQRVRLIFLVYGLFGFTYVAVMSQVGPATDAGYFPTITPLLMLVLGAYWIQGFRQRHFAPWTEPAEALIFFAAGMALYEPFEILAMLNAAVLYKSLYGSHRRAVLRYLMFLAVVIIVQQIPHGAKRFEPEGLPGPLIAIAMMTVLARIIAVSLDRYDRLLKREQRVSEMERQLITARSVEEVMEVTTRGIDRLAADDDPCTVLVMLAERDTRLRLVAANQPLLQEGQTLSLATQDWTRELLDWSRQGEMVFSRHLHAFSGRCLAPESQVKLGDSALWLPLLVRNGLQGGVIVCGRHATLLELRESLTMVGNGIALALDSINTRERFSSVVRYASDVVTIVNPAGAILFQSKSAENMFKASPKAVMGKSLLDFIDFSQREQLLELLAESIRKPQQPITGDWRWRKADGTWLETETIATNLLDVPSVRGIVLNTRDVSERKRLEQQLRHQASHDPLTGLSNRLLFSEQVRAALGRRERHGGELAVLFVDLDNFKQINDNYGHQVGDALLKGIADILRQAVRTADSAARMGGDEFAVLVEEINSSQNAVDVAERILEATNRPMVLEGVSIDVQTSIGIALAREAQSVDELMHEADIAMYVAKSNGKNRYEMYHKDMLAFAKQAAATARREAQNGAA